MRRRSAVLIVCLATAAAASTVCSADVVWPALYLENRLVSVWSIPAGLVVEYLFLWWWLKLPPLRALVADMAMNALSALVGIPLIPAVGLAWEIFPGTFIYRTFNIGTFNPITWGATCFAAALLNTGVEYLVLRYAFKVPYARRMVLGLFIANAVSVVFALASLRIAPLQL